MKVPSQIAAENRAAIGEIISATPRLVATPLPPRNFRKTEKMCPSIAAMPRTHSSATAGFNDVKGQGGNNPGELLAGVRGKGPRSNYRKHALGHVAYQRQQGGATAHCSHYIGRPDVAASGVSQVNTFYRGNQAS